MTVAAAPPASPRWVGAPPAGPAHGVGTLRAVLARRVDRPWVRDLLPVPTVAALLVADAAVSGGGRPLGALDVLAAVVGCAPLLLRRHVSIAVLGPLLTGGTALVLWRLRSYSTVVVIPMVALHELAQRGDRRHSVLLGVAVVPCVCASVLLTDQSGGTELVSVVARNVALCLVAIAAGDAARTRREAAAQAQATRDQEALRRASDERLRIAHEIHDTVAHAMTAINVRAGVAAHLLASDPEQAYVALRAIKQASGDALADLRVTLGVLRDPGLPAPTAPGASLSGIADLAASARVGGLEVGVELPDDDRGVAPAVQRAAYRIVQEALTNVVRHASATAARVVVRVEGDRLVLDVTDDGAAVGAPPGNGVRGMGERAAALGGRLCAGPAPAGGWAVRAELPLSERPPDR